MREQKPFLKLDEDKLSSCLNIIVVNMNGVEQPVFATLTDTVLSVKEKALVCAEAKLAAGYKIVLTRIISVPTNFDSTSSQAASSQEKLRFETARVLDELKTLEQEDVHEGVAFIGAFLIDLLLLMTRKRSVDNTAITNSLKRRQQSAVRGPDMLAIRLCTEFLGPERGGSSSWAAGVSSALNFYDFFGELKRILITMCDAAVRLQTLEIGHGDSANGIEMPMDEVVLSRLVHLGYNEELARRALQSSGMDLNRAIARLTEATSNPNAASTTNQPYSAVSRSSRHSPSFVPNARLLERLKEMGFEENDVIQALKISRNNHDQAVDWLLGDRKPSNSEVLRGIDPESAVYKSIMEHPTVQLGLNNPRVLRAFEDMVENPTNGPQYIHDHEIGPVLVQISRILQGCPR